MVVLNTRLAGMLAILSIASTAVSLPAGDHVSQELGSAPAGSTTVPASRQSKFHSRRASTAAPKTSSKGVSDSKSDLSETTMLSLPTALPKPSSGNKSEAPNVSHHSKHTPGEHHDDQHGSSNSSKKDHKDEVDKHNYSRDDSADPLAAVQALVANLLSTLSGILSGLGLKRRDGSIVGGDYGRYADVVLESNGRVNIHAGEPTIHVRNFEEHLHVLGRVPHHHHHDEYEHVHIHERSPSPHHHDHHHDVDIDKDIHRRVPGPHHRHDDEHKHVHIHDRRHDHYRHHDDHVHIHDRDRSKDFDMDKTRRSASSTYSHEARMRRDENPCTVGIPGIMDLNSTSQTMQPTSMVLSSISDNSTGGSPFILNASTTNSSTVCLITVPSQQDFVLLGFPTSAAPNTTYYYAMYDPNPPQPAPISVGPLDNVESQQLSPFWAYDSDTSVLRPLYASNSTSNMDPAMPQAKRDEITSSPAPQSVTLVFVPATNQQQLVTTFMPGDEPVGANQTVTTALPSQSATSSSATVATISMEDLPSSGATSPASTLSPASPELSTSSSVVPSPTPAQSITSTAPSAATSAGGEVPSMVTSEAPVQPTKVADFEWLYETVL